MQNTLNIKVSCTEEERFDNRNRLYNFVVRVPFNEKILIAITSHVFRNYIYAWLGTAHACFVLQSRS